MFLPIVLTIRVMSSTKISGLDPFLAILVVFNPKIGQTLERMSHSVELNKVFEVRKGVKGIICISLDHLMFSPNFFQTCLSLCLLWIFV